MILRIEYIYDMHSHVVVVDFNYQRDNGELILSLESHKNFKIIFYIIIMYFVSFNLLFSLLLLKEIFCKVNLWKNCF